MKIRITIGQNGGIARTVEREGGMSVLWEALWAIQEQVEKCPEIDRFVCVVNVTRSEEVKLR